MKNKIIKLFCFVIIAQICLYACCTDTYNVFVNVVDFTVRDEADDNINSISNADFNLFAKVDYDRTLVAALSKQSGFINTANATSCDQEDIVTKRVTTIELFADAPLFGIEAGNSLNNHVRTGFGHISNNFNMNDMVAAINLEQTNHSQEYYLTFDTPIPSETTVTFRIIFTFENGEQLERTAPQVTFE
ncbi:hypothetical protein [Kordia sp.]|uniref:hypothetical protein n=1 Tax=Kordia sp. TaxID=1965332 RepID=UPI003D6BE13D